MFHLTCNARAGKDGAADSLLIAFGERSGNVAYRAGLKSAAGDGYRFDDRLNANILTLFDLG